MQPVNSLGINIPPRIRPKNRCCKIFPDRQAVSWSVVFEQILFNPVFSKPLSAGRYGQAKRQLRYLLNVPGLIARDRQLWNLSGPLS
jgi:hypothetical protein